MPLPLYAHVEVKGQFAEVSFFFFFSFQPVGPRGPTQVGHQASCVSGITPLFAEVLWEEEGTGLL